MLGRPSLGSGGAALRKLQKLGLGVTRSMRRRLNNGTITAEELDCASRSANGQSSGRDGRVCVEGNSERAVAGGLQRYKVSIICLILSRRRQSCDHALPRELLGKVGVKRGGCVARQRGRGCEPSNVRP